MGEFDLIAKYFNRKSQRADVLLGVGDDAAIVDVAPDKRLVVAVDTIVESVHFLPNTSAADIAYRALAVNLSDMAAMGAIPHWMTLSLSLPQSDEAWLSDFANGLYELADAEGVALIGGDTVRGPLSITVQIMGVIERDRWLTRSGARPGDLLFVSGVVGEAAAGLATVQQKMPISAPANRLRQRFLRPEPRVTLGRQIRALATAAIDISDGLLADLNHICRSSGVGAHVDLERLPKSDAMRALFSDDACERFSLRGGDDYELLFAVPIEKVLEAEAAIADGVRCTPIGRFVNGTSVQCYRGGECIDINTRGYDHFT